MGLVNPAAIHANVDLPEPLPPWMSTPSPSWTANETSRNAVLAQGVPLAYSCPTESNSSTTGDSLSGRAAEVAGTGTVWIAVRAALPLTARRATSRSAAAASDWKCVMCTKDIRCCWVSRDNTPSRS
ncbi:Uncharacterised protein [Mycobacteroides abscessus subsp. abscessus]|nr:Uncharacterised protein [Mycobacteroides abscessus subsp. abscessus]